jgi:hypothetical protein
MNPEFHKGWRIYSAADRLLSSGGLCSMELLNFSNIVWFIFIALVSLTKSEVRGYFSSFLIDVNSNLQADSSSEIVHSSNNQSRLGCEML